MINTDNLDSSIYIEIRTLILGIDFSPNTVQILPKLDTNKAMPQIVIYPTDISSKNVMVGGGNSYNPSINIHVFDTSKKGIRFDTIVGKLRYALQNINSSYFKTKVEVTSNKISPDIHNQGVWECDLILSSDDNL